MEIVAALFVENINFRQVEGPSTRIDITGALQPGANRIEIVVTNYWANRMIGDKQPGARAQTFASIDPFTAASPLRLSGLLGPVRLLGSRE